MKSFFCYNSLHLGDGVTITPSTQNAFYDKDNLLHPHTIKEFRTTSDSDNIVIDLGAAKNVDTFIIAGNNVDRTINLTSFVLQGNDTDAWDTPEYTSATINEFYDGLAYITLPNQNLRYWRIVMVGNGTYCGFGAMFIGKRIEQHVGLNWTLSYNHRDIVTEALYGQVFGEKRNFQREVSLPMSVLTKAELDPFLDMFRYCGNILPLWCVIDPGEGAMLDAKKSAGYWRLMGEPRPSNNSYGLWNLSISLKEYV